MSLCWCWDRRSATGWAIVALLTTTLALCSSLASSASAKVIYDPVIHRAFGIYPSPAAQALAERRLSAKSRIAVTATPTCDPRIDSDCASLLTNKGNGPVQHGEEDFLFFWGPSASFPTAYVSGMQHFLSGLQAADYGTDHTTGVLGNPVSVVQQYYDHSGPGGAKSFIPLAIQNAGTIMDTTPYPNGGANCTDHDTSNGHTYSPTDCVTAQDIQHEIESYISTHHQPSGAPYPTGLDVEYFVLTPPNVGSCDDATSQACAMSEYCAWHTYGITGGGQRFTYADMPWLSGTPCDIRLTLNNDGTDSVISTFSHELSETMTDPLLNAWRGSGGDSDEVADKCAYQFAVGEDALDVAGLPQENPNTSSYYNVRLGGRNYLLQMDFDDSANNGAGGCNQWDTQSQPVATIAAPTSSAAGKARSFSLKGVSDPAGIAYVNWYFGDGGAAYSAAANGAARHTYSKPGTYTLIAIVTDKHGNELKKVSSVTVTKGGARASLSVILSTTHPAPKAPYKVTLKGQALPGGILGKAHNQSEVDLFEQAGGACLSTWAAENSRAKSHGATSIGSADVAAGSFDLSENRKATSTKHATVRFCGYLRRSAGETDTAATAAYTTT